MHRQDHQPDDNDNQSITPSRPQKPSDAGMSQVDEAHLTTRKKAATRRKKKPPASPARHRPQISIRSTPPGNRDWLWWAGSFLFGFLVGLMLSLTYGWVLDPRPRPVSPADLRAEDKAFYMRLIALAYAKNNNLEQAQQRLAAFEAADVASNVAALTEQYIQQERDVRDIKALVALSEALGQTTSVMAAFIVTPTPLPTNTPTPAPTPTPRPTHTPTPKASPPATPAPSATPTKTPTRRPSRTSTATPTPTASRTPTATPTPTATNTPTPGPNSPFGLAQSVVLCDDSGSGGLLRVYVRDRLGAGVPGVQVKITWSGGEDSFFTGFKPEIDLGYADFQMRPDQQYDLTLANVETAGEMPEVKWDNQALCPNLPANVQPSWQVVFQQGASR